jgi:hypothetical protein
MQGNIPLCRTAFTTSAVAALVGTASPAMACRQWIIPSVMYARQANGCVVTFQLKQQGNTITGSAGYKTNKRTLFGNVRGGLSKDRFFMRAYWTYSGVNSIGVYMGSIQSGYILNDLTYDQQAQPAVKSRWSSQEPFNCEIRPVLPGRAS